LFRTHTLHGRPSSDAERLYA